MPCGPNTRIGSRPCLAFLARAVRAHGGHPAHDLVHRDLAVVPVPVIPRVHRGAAVIAHHPESALLDSDGERHLARPVARRHIGLGERNPVHGEPASGVAAGDSVAGQPDHPLHEPRCRVARGGFGVSGRDMMAALIAGERDPEVLAQRARHAGLRTSVPGPEEGRTSAVRWHGAGLGRGPRGASAVASTRGRPAARAGRELPRGGGRAGPDRAARPVGHGRRRRRPGEHGRTGRDAEPEAPGAAGRRRMAVPQRVPESDLVQDHAGLDTDATARNLAAFMAAHRLRTALVATQYFHVPRTELAGTAWTSSAPGTRGSSSGATSTPSPARSSPIRPTPWA